MRTHIRTTLVALVMTCTTVTSAGRAAQQSPTQGAARIAYEHCFMDLEGGGVRCDIRLWIDGSDTHAVPRRCSAEMVTRVRGSFLSTLASTPTTTVEIAIVMSPTRASSPISQA